MTKEEYIKKIADAEKVYNSEKRKIAKEYAFSNNPYEIGDIIRTRIVGIKIEEITWGYNSLDGTPSCTYIGTTLTKKNTPTARLTKERITQSNIVSHIPKDQLKTT